MIVCRKTFVAMLGLWATIGPTQAAAGSEGALTVTMENDTFTSSDNNYTNGIGITWGSGAVEADDDGRSVLLRERHLVAMPKRAWQHVMLFEG